ncbi:MAG: acetolactate synthase large subunit [Methanomassiliicoccales archaeon]
MRASDLLVKCLENEGVSRVFGIPGEENLDIVDSLIDSGIELVVPKHETSAAFMAEISARLTGRPGVCLSTLGPGATNMVTGVADAYLSYAPLIALTGQAGTGKCPPHKQFVDLVELYRPITKESLCLWDPRGIPEAVQRAFHLAREEKPGPVHLELPEDVMKSEVEGEPLPPMEISYPCPDEESLDRLREMLIRSQRPLVICGQGVIRGAAQRDLLEFAEEWLVPVTHTWMGNGVLPFRHPLNLHTVGLRHSDHATEALQKADLIVLLGFDTLEFQPEFWRVGEEKDVIQVAPVKVEEEATLCPDLEVIGNIGSALQAMIPGMLKGNWASEIRDRIRRTLQEVPADSLPIKPQLAVSTIREVMGMEDIVVCDVGAHMLWMMKNYPTHQENTLIASNGLIPMGLGLPGAIAAKLVRPLSRVVAVCGDGGFMMTSTELETAHRLGTPLVVVVFNDSGYGLIRTRQQHAYGRTSGVDFGNPDLVQYAKSFGAQACRVESAQELGVTLQRYLDEERLGLIEVPVDYSENPKLTQ